MTRMIEIDKVTVYVMPHGLDQIDFQTNRPSPFPEEVDNTPLVLTAKVPRHTGMSYMQKNFGFAPDYIDTRSADERAREDKERR
jgi:hypothetical protein